MIRITTYIIVLYFIGSSRVSYQDNITTSNYSIIEICDNGIDDDQNGFVDAYDEDCECNNEYFQAQCESKCEQIDTSEEIQLRLKWTSEELNESDFPGPRNIAIDNKNQIYLRYSSDIVDSFANKMVVIDGQNGFIINLIGIDTSENRNSNNLALASFSNFGSTMIFTKNESKELICIDSNGNEIWKNNDFVELGPLFRNPKLADFNLDGIPELYSESNVINALTGKTLFKGQGSQGCNIGFPNTPCIGGNSNSIAGNFTDNFGLELAAGNNVYELNLINLNDTIGNTANIITAPMEILDGGTSMADFDGDGHLEVLINRWDTFGDGGMWIWNPRDNTLLASVLPNGDRGGLPTIADISGDCIPEIIVTHINSLDVYSYQNSPLLSLSYSIPTSDNSGITGATVFDLNQDGIKEIIYRD